MDERSKRILAIKRAEEIEPEIARIYRRHRRRVAGSISVHTTWEILDDSLCWYVMLRDVLEPDIDLEVLPDVVIVRALAGSSLCHALVPVPEHYRFEARNVRMRSSTLEIHLHA